MADRYTRRINLYINDKEVRNDIASIRKEMMKAQQAQNKMIIGSKEYVAQGRKIAMLKGIMNKHNADLQKAQRNWFSLSRVADTATKYMSVAMSAFAGIVAIAMGFRSASQAAM